MANTQPTGEDAGAMSPAVTPFANGEEEQLSKREEDQSGAAGPAPPTAARLAKRTGGPRTSTLSVAGHDATEEPLAFKIPSLSASLSHGLSVSSLNHHLDQVMYDHHAQYGAPAEGHTAPFPLRRPIAPTSPLPPLPGGESAGPPPSDPSSPTRSTLPRKGSEERRNSVGTLLGRAFGAMTPPEGEKHPTSATSTPSTKRKSHRNSLTSLLSRPIEFLQRPSSAASTEKDRHKHDGGEMGKRHATFLPSPSEASEKLSSIQERTAAHGASLHAALVSPMTPEKDHHQRFAVYQQSPDGASRTLPMQMPSPQPHAISSSSTLASTSSSDPQTTPRHLASPLATSTPASSSMQPPHFQSTSFAQLPQSYTGPTPIAIAANAASPSVASFSVGSAYNVSSSPRFITSPPEATLQHQAQTASVHAGDKRSREIWQEIALRLFPLFNGEGLKGRMESLHALIDSYIGLQTSIAFVVQQFQDLLYHCFAPFETKLVGVQEEAKLISRLVEIWTFLYGNVLPYFEAALLPLQHKILDLSTTAAFNQENKALNAITSPRMDKSILIEEEEEEMIRDAPLYLDAAESIQAGNNSSRHILLLAFRNQVIIPSIDKIKDAISKCFVPMDPAEPSTAANFPDTLPRVLQLFCVLYTLHTKKDERQALIKEVMVALQAKARRPLPSQGKYASLIRHTYDEPNISADPFGVSSKSSVKGEVPPQQRIEGAQKQRNTANPPRGAV